MVPLSTRSPFTPAPPGRILKRLRPCPGSVCRYHIPLVGVVHEAPCLFIYLGILPHFEHFRPGRRRNVALQRVSDKQSEGKIWIRAHPDLARSRPPFFRP